MNNHPSIRAIGELASDDAYCGRDQFSPAAIIGIATSPSREGDWIYEQCSVEVALAHGRI
ncbi:MAG: hypothetical protein GY721_12445 [Deltaproteobacteria bacterium]|nr:hypothetical protein [Deltaproteobacteria bacterium]